MKGVSRRGNMSRSQLQILFDAIDDTATTCVNAKVIDTTLEIRNVGINLAHLYM